MELNAEFIERTKRLFGEERYTRFESALATDPIVSVRNNPAKAHEAPSDDPVRWSTGAYYLDTRPVFTGDPLFHAGCYYVQEASSMFLEQVVKQYIDAPVRVLDLCAAPGGKSTHLLSSLPQGSLLVSNEPVALRAQILAENIIKWGNPSAVVTKNDPADFASLRNFFDVILVDAPCSGEGMFRKDAYAVEQWGQNIVQQCARRQRNIMEDVWPALRPGGMLIYSTCTFNREENEDNLAWMAAAMGADVLPLDVDDEWGVTGNLVGSPYPVYRFIPGHTRGEGFFLSVLRKHGDTPVVQPRERRMRQCPSKVRSLVSEWIKEPSRFDFLLQGDSIVALPREHTATITSLQAKLNVLHAALPVATVKNYKPLPLHSLAMSTELNTAAFTRVELDRMQALHYLHRETLDLQELPIGILLLTYNGVPIGFAKNIGNRANNLYPAEWRIRKNPVEL